MVSTVEIHQTKILIVDDQQVNVTLLKKVLGSAGHTCLDSTCDPTSVCELHRKNQYDLILLDIQMPGMDGFQVMEGLKEVESGGYLPVLAITAQPDHKLRALKSGAKDFVSKPFDLAEIAQRVYNMLEVRLLHQETRQLCARLVAEQKVSNQLLLNVVPPAIADRLKGRHDIIEESSTEVIADYFADVTVLFADIVDFTKFSDAVSVHVLVSVLNDIFSRFDAIAEHRGLEKIKTIGDSYMVASGLPVAVPDHATRAAHMALDMLEAMTDFNMQSPYKLRLRIGIDTGAVVAGVIGKHRFIYDLWGDVVNTASRMESYGEAGRIQITESTCQRLSDPFRMEPRGAIDVKGKGAMNTWFLEGRDR